MRASGPWRRIRIGPASMRIMGPVDPARSDDPPLELPRIETEDFRKRAEPYFHQFIFAEIGHCFRLGAGEPARQEREFDWMLRPPDRDPRVRRQERQINEITSLFEPPGGLEPKQN